MAPAPRWKMRPRVASTKFARRRPSRSRPSQACDDSFADASAQLATVTPQHSGTTSNSSPRCRSLNHDGPALAAADVDGDGDTDLLVTDTTIRSCSMLLNDGAELQAIGQLAALRGTGLIPFTYGQAQMLLHLSEPPAVYTIENGQLRLAKRLARRYARQCGGVRCRGRRRHRPVHWRRHSSQFPPPPSVLFINNGGDFAPRVFPGLGLVRALRQVTRTATASLVLVREWNSIALLQNNAGNFIEAGSNALGLGAYKDSGTAPSLRT